jgi:hypothetical protein
MEQKRFEVLNSLPIYGPMYVPVNNVDEPFFSEGFVVRFFKSDGTNWVGNFKPGATSLKAVYPLEHQERVLVISGGICYLVNPDEQKPKAIVRGYVEKVIESSNHHLILQDSLLLTIVEPNGNYWSTERISWDGIVDLKLEGNLITGLACDPGPGGNNWVEFEVDLQNRTLKGGSWSQKSYNDFLPNTNEYKSTFPKEQQKKPWWKI